MSTQSQRGRLKRQDTPINVDKREKVTTSHFMKKCLSRRSLSTPSSQRTSSCDGKQHSPKFQQTKGRSALYPATSNPSSSASSAPSFICSVDLVDSDDSPDKDKIPVDEFAQFVNASVNPPNELSVPRCYPEPFYFAKEKGFQRSKSACTSTAEKSQLLRPCSMSYPSSPRPCLRRESAQDMEDVDIINSSDKQSPHSSALFASHYSSLSVSPQISRTPSPINVKSHLIFQNKSAPGSPGNNRFSSQTPSDESGHLHVPLSRTRGSSLPESMEESLTKNKFYLLKQFNIQGSRVIHMGDSFQQRDTSNNTHLSPRSFSRNSSFSRNASGRSSMENNYSTDDEKESLLEVVGDEEWYSTRHRVILVGGSGVGKTSLQEKFLSPENSQFYESVYGPDAEQSVCVMLEDVESELLFTETQRAEMVELADCDCVLVVFSLTSSASLREAEFILQKLWQAGDLNTKVVIVVGNKTDLVRTREVPIDEARFIATSHGCKYVEVSSTLDHNVDTLLVGIVKQVRLKMIREERSNHHSTYSRRRSAGVRVRGIIEKVIGGNSTPKSCENLNVL